MAVTGIAVAIQRRETSRFVIARPRRGRGALSAKREEVPLGCNLGKALTARTNHRRPHALPNLTVAAVSDRLVQSHSTAGGHWCTAALPDVSLRGAKRRGNLAVHSWITGRPRRKRNCLPEIATAPLGPRNDKSVGLAPQNVCRNHRQPARRLPPAKGTLRPFFTKKFEKSRFSPCGFCLRVVYFHFVDKKSIRPDTEGTVFHDGSEKHSKYRHHRTR